MSSTDDHIGLTALSRDFISQKPTRMQSVISFN
jgi:hypothetical protein